MWEEKQAKKYKEVQRKSNPKEECWLQLEKKAWFKVKAAMGFGSWSYIDPLPEHHVPFDIFPVVTGIDNLIKLIVVESNLYAQQKERQFQTNEQEARAFLGINYVMFVNKLSRINSYWECGQYVGNEDIFNVMSRSRFEEILQNLHFSDNTKDDKSD